MGDILTVLVSIADVATFDNGTSTSKSSAEAMGVPSLFGLESQLPKILSKAVNAGNLVSTNSSSTNTATGSIKRDETVTLRLAGVVTQVLPNGNLVISARQEVRGERGIAGSAGDGRGAATGYRQRQHGHA